mmetsp:Transcript_50494/g.101572  ORF Transcript_50494/g.101572 Transcript_50494/m.101572 type:complete len:158 (+) Transcript_50494:101-574(+)
MAAAAAAAAAVWLRKQGYHPERDLIKLKLSNRVREEQCWDIVSFNDEGEVEYFDEYDEYHLPDRYPKYTTTAMLEACLAGELVVCQWLFEHGAASSIRQACGENHMGCTPMFAAVLNGHLDVAMWLFEVGAADDIHTKGRISGDGIDKTPMAVACGQ